MRKRRREEKKNNSDLASQNRLSTFDSRLSCSDNSSPKRYHEKRNSLQSLNGPFNETLPANKLVNQSIPDTDYYSANQLFE